MRYERAQEFSDGLAAVRDGLKWGYIDASGKIVIPLQYDWVLPFTDGITEVCRTGKRQWIDQEGRVAFENPFDAQHPSSADHDVGKSPGGSAVAINRFLRKVIRDSSYHQIRFFFDGVAVVAGRLIQDADKVSGSPEVRELAVIDREGVVLIPFGRFADLSDFHDGYATSLVYKDGVGLPLSIQVIDHLGNVMSEFSFSDWDVSPTDLVFSEGVATVRVYRKETLPNRLDILAPTVVCRLALVRPNGQVIVETSRETVTPFHEGRAFAKLPGGPWMLIDTAGQPVGDKQWLDLPLRSYWESRPSDFENGYAFGRLENAFGWIDVQGNFTPAPLRLGANERFVVRCADFAILERTDPGKEPRYGFWHLPSNKMVAPSFRSIEVCHAKGPLIRAETEDLEGYVDLNGTFIWKSRMCKDRAKD